MLVIVAKQIRRQAVFINCKCMVRFIIYLLSAHGGGGHADHALRSRQRVVSAIGCYESDG